MNIVSYSSSFISYFSSFFWGICIIFSMIGWGELIRRVLFKYQLDWGLVATWGLAFSVFIGGILNLTWTISKLTVLVYLLLGLFCYLTFYFDRVTNFLINLPTYFIRQYKEDKIQVGGIFFIIFLLIIIVDSI